MATKLNLTIVQGKTFKQLVRWETEPVIYKPITAITQAAPVSITATAHGLPDGWRAAIQSVKGMTQINASVAAPKAPKDKDYHKVTVVDANTLTLNDVNSLSFSAYTSSGTLIYNTPQPLTGYTARMSIKDKVGGTELVSLTTANSGIVIDTAAYTILLTLTATATAAFDWTSGVYDLEMVSNTGEVELLLFGNVSVTKEVTT